MKWALLCLILLPAWPARAQQGGLPKEAFLNAVAGQLISGSPSRFYLLREASPCSFYKFNYDERVNYGLREKVSFPVLNELSEKAYTDRAPAIGPAGKTNEDKRDSCRRLSRHRRGRNGGDGRND